MRILSILIFFVISTNIALSDVIRDYYAEPGLHSFKDNLNQTANEHIDPFSGNLSITHTDLVVPGNGGLDIVINRVYNSLQETVGLQSVTGVGWTIHFGRIVVSSSNASKICNQGTLSVSTTDNPSLELSDGSRKLLVLSTNQANAYLVTKDNWKAECNSPGEGLVVTSPSGTQYIMDQFEFNGTAGVTQEVVSFYTSKIIDRNGNFLNINYKYNFGIRYIDTVTSSDSRTVSFNYSNLNSANVLLKSISANGQTWNYKFKKVTTTGPLANYNYMTQVDSPVTSFKWYYSYYPENLNASVFGSFSLKQITYPSGGRVQYSYDGIVFDVDVTFPTTVVKKKTIIGGGVWLFKYTPAALFTSNIYDQTTVTAPNGKYVYRHVGYSNTTSGNMWKVGLLHDKKLYDSSNNLIQTETNTWTNRIISIENYWHGRNTLRIDNFTYAPMLSNRTITRDSTNTSFVTNFLNYDEFGNPATINESQGSNSRITNFIYRNDIANWILGLVENEAITGLAGNTTRTYDPGNGNLLTENKYGAKTSYKYYQSGDVREITDPELKVTWFGKIGGFGQISDYIRGVPQTENHSEAVTVSRTVNSNGTISSETNGRGKTLSYGYDKLNRLTSITYPKLGTSALSVVYAATSKSITRGLYNKTITYDGFSRPTTITTNGITVTHAYDDLGQKTFTSYPNKSTGTSTTYDVLGRIKTMIHPDNSFQSLSYQSGNKTVITNERNFATTNTFRSYGSPDEQYLMNSAAPEGITTSYTRNKLGQIETITQSGKTRTYGYDSRYYLTSITNPETGVTTYGRDNVGNMISQKVGLSGTTTFQYDDLHRLKFVNYPSTAANPDVTYVYDKNSNIDTVTQNGIIRKQSYDDNDNVISNKLTIDAKNFELLYSYDVLDNLNTITYPSGRIVTYVPNALGQATQASPYITSVTYYANGTPSITSYANGVVETKTLTVNRDWVDTVTATGVIDLDYNYDFRGNITSITNGLDSTKNLSMTGYDGVDRLTSVIGSWGVGNIAYDALGNIKSKNIGTATLAYTYDLTTNKLTNTTGIVNNTYQYDAYGNIKNNGTNVFVFDDASNMVSANGSTSLANTYDGNNVLVKSVKSSYTTYHLYDQKYNLMGEYNSSGTLRKETVRLNGKAVAVITDQPEIPASVSVSTPNVTGGYTISWPSIAGDISHYEIAVSSDSSCTNTTSVATSTSLSYDVTNQADGTYYYCVRACNGTICSDYQNSGSSCAVVGSNSAPCLLASITSPVNNNTGNFSVSWAQAVGTVTQYELYEANNSSFSNQVLVYSGLNLNHNITAKSDGLYYYQVRACNNSLCSEYIQSNTTVALSPIGPNSITAPTSSSTGSYTVSWTVASGNVSYYELEEKYYTSSGTFVGTTLFNTNTNLFKNFTLKPEGNYTYTVIACNGSNSACSVPVGAITVVVQNPPSIPATIVIPTLNNTGVYNISWQAATGVVTRYELFEAKNADFSDQQLVYSGNTLNTNIGLKPDGIYYYKVRACNDGACSDFVIGSNAVTVTDSPFIAVIMIIINSLLLD